jgi:hypothetical protein
MDFCVGGSTGGAVIVPFPAARVFPPSRLLVRARALILDLFLFFALALAFGLCVGVIHIVVRKRFLPRGF